MDDLKVLRALQASDAMNSFLSILKQDEQKRTIDGGSGIDIGGTITHSDMGGTITHSDITNCEQIGVRVWVPQRIIMVQQWLMG